jgi:hypothetical protein
MPCPPINCSGRFERTYCLRLQGEAIQGESLTLIFQSEWLLEPRISGCLILELLWFKVQAIVLREGSITHSWFKVQAVTLRERSISHSWFKVQAVTLREGSINHSWFKVQSLWGKGQSLTLDSRFKQSLWGKGQSVTLESRFKQSLRFKGSVTRFKFQAVTVIAWTMSQSYCCTRESRWLLILNLEWLLDPWISECLTLE